jgi:hypothetical protein
MGYIAEGNPTFIVEGGAVATHGHAVQCGCPFGSNRLIATQSTVMAAEDGGVGIAPDFAALAQAATHVWAKAISDGSYVSEYSCDIPAQGLTGFMSPKTTPPEKTETVVQRPGHDGATGRLHRRRDEPQYQRPSSVGNERTKQL